MFRLCLDFLARNHYNSEEQHATQIDCGREYVRMQEVSYRHEDRCVHCFVH